MFRVQVKLKSLRYKSDHPVEFRKGRDRIKLNLSRSPHRFDREVESGGQYIVWSFQVRGGEVLFNY